MADLATTAAEPGPAWPFDGGRMGDLIRRREWSGTRLGPPRDWPQVLRNVVELVLESPVPMCVLWGQDCIALYNDAFAALPADRHPETLGAPMQDSWPDLWACQHGVLARARGGHPQVFRARELPTDCPPGQECGWFDLNYSPIRLPDGLVAGVLLTAVEVTAQQRAEQARRDAKSALHDSEARLDAIFAQMAVGIAQADATSRFLKVNDGLCAILGRSREELLEHTILDLTHPDDRARNLHLYRDLFATGAPFSLHKRYVWPDGSIVWAEVHVSLIRDEAGAPRYAVAVVLDATARHEAERRQMRLMAELNHRVKNTLATVQAVAQQTLRSSLDDPAQFGAKFGARLRALAAAHDLLTRQAWDGAGLRQVAETALAPWLSDRDGDRITLESGPDVRVDARQAQALVLALHELATNAAKHGALSGAGRVRLRWALRDGRVALHWEETGGPPLAGPPQRQGFGTRLLQQALGRDLGQGGAVEMAFHPTGLRATIRFPVRDLAPWATHRAAVLPDA